MPRAQVITTPLTDRAFSRILIVKPSSLGDVVHGLPVLRALRRRNQEAFIAWLVFDAFAPLLEGHRDLDELIRVDRRRLGRMAWHPGAVAYFLQLVRRLRALRFDLAIDLQGLFRSGVLTRASNAPVRVGRRQSRELSTLFYTHLVDADSAGPHAVDCNMALARAVGADCDPVEFDLCLSERDRDEADAVLRRAGLADDEPFAAVLPGARWETKRWPAERFARLAEGMADTLGLRSVLLGGTDERRICATVAGRAAGAAVDCSGRTSLRQLAAIIGRASVVVAHDSGPMHLAVALQRPLVAVIGPTNAVRTGPFGRLDTVVRLDLDCSPCYLRRLNQCPHGHACMNDLDVTRVLNAVRNQVAAAGFVSGKRQ